MLKRLLNLTAKRPNNSAPTSGLAETGYRYAVLEGKDAETLVRHYLQHRHEGPDHLNLG